MFQKKFNDVKKSGTNKEVNTKYFYVAARATVVYP